MRAETLRKAIAEAERFLAAARRVKVEVVHGPNGDFETIYPGLHRNGACKRASLDLSKALAEMRGYR